MPLYSLAYALYYNKKMFADAGIAQPPATWDELVADGKKLTKDGKWGAGRRGRATSPKNIHHVFVFGKQHGADFFDAAGKPDLHLRRRGRGGQAVRRLHGQGQDRRPGQRRVRPEPVAAATSPTARRRCCCGRPPPPPSQSQGMKPDDYGVAPVPVPAGAPGTRQEGQLAWSPGINMAVFKNTKNIDGAMKFVKFMTSDAEQKHPQQGLRLASRRSRPRRRTRRSTPPS